MKRIYVKEDWCLGCHLCEYNCAYANSGNPDMVKALKDVAIRPRIRIEEAGGISFAVSCRHCEEPLCVRNCITGSLRIVDGVITVDQEKCVGCFTCVLSCPYGAVMPTAAGVVQKCELCLRNAAGSPACVTGCPNGAIVYEEKEARECAM
ncbi:MAG: 4Fe-4S dicluster domain-containing protein [Peptococcaceae bacterium]|jgi:carbon-monoxide dehydrogenase iron sulfur subunit|nr:4Fe-4S dicluster domain-containing protein [Peptococcaceae bacterium]